MKITCLLLMCAVVWVGATCPNGCKCSRFGHVIRCREAAMNEIPFVDPHLSIYSLDLSHNNITELRNGSFKARNVVRLYMLILSENNISVVEENAFHGLGESLVSLSLQGNTHIQLPAFGFNLPTLMYLYLDRCNLASIPASFFTTISSLTSLSLRENKLRSFDPKILKPPSGLQLEWLSLTANNFTAFSLELVSNPKMRIGFGGNPLHCDCYVRAVFKVLARSGTRRETCASPPRLHGVSGSELLEMRLHCDPNGSELLEDDTPWDLHQWLVPCSVALVGAAALVVYLLWARLWVTRRAWLKDFPNLGHSRNLTTLQKNCIDGESVLLED